jgi:hypothetical protein
VKPGAEDAAICPERALRILAASDLGAAFAPSRLIRRDEWPR